VHVALIQRASASFGERQIMSVKERIDAILVDLLDIEPADLVSSATLREDLSASSVDLVEILAAIENEFGVDIPESELVGVDTYGKFVEFMQAKLGET
jgi:acyl carrier protein